MVGFLGFRCAACREAGNRTVILLAQEVQDFSEEKSHHRTPPPQKQRMSPGMGHFFRCYVLSRALFRGRLKRNRCAVQIDIWRCQKKRNNQKRDIQNGDFDWFLDMRTI